MSKYRIRMSMKETIATVAQTAFRRVGFDIRRTAPPVPGIPDADLYRPRFEPWESRKWDEIFAPALERSLVSRDRLYVLYTMLQQARSTVDGDVIECGVYRGGTARMFGDLLQRTHAGKRLFLCDTFEGMPEVNAQLDLHHRGDFSDTSLQGVREFLSGISNVEFVQGVIPQSFASMPANVRFCFAHIDLDIHDAVLAASEYVYERLNPGGFIIYDDYGFASCPGARRAVEAFFQNRPERPLVLASGQCIVFRNR